MHGQGFHRGWVASLALAALAISLGCHADERERIDLNIPSLPLRDALRLFVNQVHDYIAIQGAYFCSPDRSDPNKPCVNSEDASRIAAWDFDLGVRSHPVVGRFDLHSALEEMTRGTGLRVQLSIEMRHEGGIEQPTQRFNILSVKTVLSRETDQDRDGGTPWLPQASHEQNLLSEVLVTGSHLKGVDAIESPLVHQTRKDLTRGPYATAQEAVQSLTMVSRAGPSEVSLINNFGAGASVNLRGLGPSGTLVLVDGHRQATSGAMGDFVDISTIPISAIERIDVLPDGASATYGADAIAGVVNIILRRDLRGAETQMHVASSRGGGDEALVSQLFGLHWDAGKLFGAYQFSRRDSLPASARGYAANSDKTPLGGTDYRSIRSAPGNLIDPRTGQPEFAIPQGQDGSSLSMSDLQAGTINRRNRNADLDLLPDTRLHSVFVSAEQSLGSHFKLRSESWFSQRGILQHSYAVDGLLLVPRSNAFFPSGLPAPFAVVAYSFDRDLGPVQNEARSRSYSGSLSLTADLGHAWTGTLDRSQSNGELRWTMSHLTDVGTLNAALANSNPTSAFNPFGDGGHTEPGVLASIEAIDSEGIATRVVTTQLMVQGPVFTFATGVAHLAAGVEERTEGFHRLTALQTSADRRARAAFTELVIPLMGHAGNSPTTPRVQLSLAGRGDRYANSGSTFNPKLGLEATLSSTAKLRGTWGTSFAAPHLVDLYDDGRNHAGLASLTDPRSASGKSFALVVQGNNPGLQQERARTWTAGIDLAPVALPGLTASLTYYDIRYWDRIFLPTAGDLSAALADNRWASLVTREPDTASVEAICAARGFIGDPSQCTRVPIAAIVDGRAHNAASLAMRGLDLNLVQTLSTKWGELRFDFDGSYIFQMDQALSAAPPETLLNTLGNPASQRARVAFEWTEHGTNRPGWGAQLVLDYSGSCHDAGSAVHPEIKRSIAADVRASYRASSEIDIDIVVNNVLNSAPPFVDREIGYDVGNARPYGRILGLFLRMGW